jgi:hypothetical protein
MAAYGGRGLLNRTEKRTEDSLAAGTITAVQSAHDAYLCKALPTLFDAVHTQFVLAQKGCLEMVLLVTRLEKAYRDKGAPTTCKALQADLRDLAVHATEWCAAFRAASSGKEYFKVDRTLQHHRIAALRVALTQISS